MTSPHDPSERERLSAHYDTLRREDHAQRWSFDNPGNRAAHDERQRFFERTTRTVGPSPLLMDLGCGSASIIPGFESSFRVGVDILFERLAEEHHTGLDALVNADGTSMPLPSGSIDVVLMFTMLSSVTSDVARQHIAREVERVLRPGGLVVWYDMRYPSPGNREMHPIRRRELARLFAGFDRDVRSLTVLPPLARRLGRFTPRWYPLLAHLPFLRSHLAGTMVKR